MFVSYVLYKMPIFDGLHRHHIYIQSKKNIYNAVHYYGQQIVGAKKKFLIRLQ